MASVAAFSVISHTSNESLQSDLPNLSVSVSSPLIKSQPPQLSVDSQNTINVLKSLPFSVVLSTSNNTKLSLQLIEVNEEKQDKSKTKKETNIPFSKNGTDYRLGDLVIINKTKQGLIRYIGELHNDSHTWYGIELIGGNKGFNDGCFQGTKYFECGAHRGIFIKKHQIRRKMNFSDFVHKKPKLKIINRKSAKMRTRPRPKSVQMRPKSAKRSSMNNLDLKKQGPRDIGRVRSKATDWRPIAGADKIIEAENAKGFLQPSVFASNTQRRMRASSTASLVRKSGPRSRSRNGSVSSKKTQKKSDKKKKIKPRGLISLLPIKLRQRSSTPTPTTKGLKIKSTNNRHRSKRHKKDKKKKKKKKTKPSIHKKYDIESEMSFPDIMAFTDGNSKSQKPPVVIRVSSEDMNKKTKLNMSKTEQEMDTVLFAEVNVEIQERNQNSLQIEQQLNALELTDFDSEFEQSLEDAKISQSAFRVSHNKLVLEIESDIEEASQMSSKRISAAKIKKMLWNDENDAQNGDNANNDDTQYVE